MYTCTPYIFAKQSKLVATLHAPAEPRPGHPGQLARLVQQREAGGEREVRTQGRRPVRGGRRRGREAGGGAADDAAEPGTAPPSLRART